MHVYTVNNAMAQAGIHIQISGVRGFRIFYTTRTELSSDALGKETVTALKPFTIAIHCFPVPLSWIHILAELINKLSRSNHVNAEVIHTLNYAYEQKQ